MKRQKNEDFDDALSWDLDRKESEEEKKYFKTNVLVPKNAVIRKEEGATVAATPTFSSAGCLFIFQAGPAAFFHGVLQTIGKTPLTT